LLALSSAIAVAQDIQKDPLIAAVEAGDLPPLEERLPDNPLVVGPGLLMPEAALPDWEPGQHGGTLRTAFTSAFGFSGEMYVMNLEPIIAALFGGDRLWGYDFPFPVTDRKLIAAEYGELGLAIENGGTIEVDAAQGARSVALSYAMLESSVAGRALSMDEVLSEEVDAYQLEIDEEIGLV